MKTDIGNYSVFLLSEDHFDEIDVPERTQEGDAVQFQGFSLDVQDNASRFQGEIARETLQLRALFHEIPIIFMKKGFHSLSKV
jgi:hypothetical protein